MVQVSFTTQKRPLLQNYYNFIKTDEAVTKERDLFLSEPGDPDSHYSVYEDLHGTHIFANNDLDMMTKLSELVEHGFDHWKLDGVYCPGENFVKITEYFVKARDLIELANFHKIKPSFFDELFINYTQPTVVWTQVSTTMNLTV